MQHANIYLVALTKRNSNVTSIFVFLERLVEIMREYFGLLEEESIRDNFVLIYELLDEVMDFGYPQISEVKGASRVCGAHAAPARAARRRCSAHSSSRPPPLPAPRLPRPVLKEYITQGAHKLAISKPPQAVTNVVSWRPEGIKYKKNEVFLDVIERQNCLVAANGSVISSEILG